MSSTLIKFTTDSKEPQRILLVDDNPTNLQVLFQTLEGRGYKLLIAKSGGSIPTRVTPRQILNPGEHQVKSYEKLTKP